jgi:Holliday junction resolvase RusA-like endonuclease
VGKGGVGKMDVGDRAMKFRFDIEPMGAVRATHKMARHRNKTTPIQRYINYKTAAQLMAKQQYKGEPSKAAIGIPRITFYMPIPKDGKTEKIIDGKKKRIPVKDGDYHTKKPDVDNILKGVQDFLNGIVWVDDSQVCHIGEVRKVYSDKPRIELEVIELF